MGTTMKKLMILMLLFTFAATTLGYTEPVEAKSKKHSSKSKNKKRGTASVKKAKKGKKKKHH